MKYRLRSEMFLFMDERSEAKVVLSGNKNRFSKIMKENGT